MKAARIKVCGMRDAENMVALYRLPIDYMGLIFYAKSPRFVSENTAAIADCPPHIAKVGVFVNAAVTEVADTVVAYGLSAVQLHGNETPQYMAELADFLAQKGHKTALFKAFSVDTDFNFDDTTAYETIADTFIFDTKTPQYGGSGLKFDWKILSQYGGNTPFLLSGGISDTDIEHLADFSHPKCIGLDLNSKFETAPGHKDIERLSAFLKQIQ